MTWKMLLGSLLISAAFLLLLYGVTISVCMYFGVGGKHTAEFLIDHLGQPDWNYQEFQGCRIYTHKGWRYGIHIKNVSDEPVLLHTSTYVFERGQVTYRLMPGKVAVVRCYGFPSVDIEFNRKLLTLRKD